MESQYWEICDASVCESEARLVHTEIKNDIIHNNKVPLYHQDFGVGQELFNILDLNSSYIGQIDPITNKKMTFAEIKDRSIRSALWLKSQGVTCGNVVGVFMDHHLDYMTTILGSLFIGACPYPLTLQMNIHECRCFLFLMKPKIVFVSAEIATIMSQAEEEEKVAVKIVTFGEKSGFQNIHEIIEKQDSVAVERFRCTKISHPDDTALYILSPRGTWLTKTVMISHCSLINYIQNDHFFWRGERVVLWLNVFRLYNDIILLLQSIYFHKTWIIYRRQFGIHEELACELIEKYNVEWLWLRSFSIIRILRKKMFSKYRLSSLKKIVIGDIGMEMNLLEPLKKVLPNTKIIFVYRMAELCDVSALHINDYNIDSIGFGIYNSKLKILDTETGKTLKAHNVGNLVWKSPYMMNGYYNNINRKINRVTRKIIDRDWWLHSDDIGYYNDHGEVYICERKKAIKVKGGFVYLSEIESILRCLPGIREVAVMFVQYNTNIKYLFAFVSAYPYPEVTKDQIINFVANVLEDNKHLFEDIIFLYELPRTETHKIAKQPLREKALGLENEE